MSPLTSRGRGGGGGGLVRCRCVLSRALPANSIISTQSPPFSISLDLSLFLIFSGIIKNYVFIFYLTLMDVVRFA